MHSGFVPRIVFAIILLPITFSPVLASAKPLWMIVEDNSPYG
jgi:hypothetical protein